MAQETQSVPLIGVSFPFPLEELYVPILALLFFFASMVFVGQIVTRSMPSSAKKKAN
jgi:hypothetical protein